MRATYSFLGDLILEFGNVISRVFLVFFVTFFVELNLKTCTVFTGEFLLGGGDNADGDNEADESDKWVDESNNLPEVVVTSVTSAECVKVNVGLEVPHHKGE